MSETWFNYFNSWVSYLFYSDKKAKCSICQDNTDCMYSSFLGLSGPQSQLPYYCPECDNEVFFDQNNSSEDLYKSLHIYTINQDDSSNSFYDLSYYTSDDISDTLSYDSSNDLSE